MLARTSAVIMLLCSAGFAEIGADKFEHAGVSAALNGLTYTLCTGALGRSVDIRPGCLVASTFMTGMVGVLTEVNDSVNTHSPTLDTGDLAADAVGLAVSALVIYTIDIHGQKDGPKVGYKNNMLTIGWNF